MKFVVTKDTLIGEVIEADPSSVSCFFEMGMECVGWPAARGETLEEASMVHGIDVNILIQKLNQHFGN